jgi:hypothetical protein
MRVVCRRWVGWLCLFWVHNLYSLDFPAHPRNLREILDTIELGSAVPHPDIRHWKNVDGEAAYRPRVSPPIFFHPRRDLPARVPLRDANNNVAIAYFDGRLFVGWRNANSHFPGPSAQMIVMSSTNWGETWTYETSVAIEKDLREPFFVEIAGKLYFQYFGGGASSVQFTPQDTWRLERRALADWGPPTTVGQKYEVPWDYKTVDGQIFHTTYLGNHYGFVPTQRRQTSQKDINVFLKYTRSADGWRYVTPLMSEADSRRPFALRTGGTCESSIEILPPAAPVTTELSKEGYESFGRLVSVMRIEDGDVVDSSGVKRIGSFLSTGDLFKRDNDFYVANYREHYSRFSYDSPRTFSHGNDAYLVARRTVKYFSGEKEPRNIPTEFDLGLWVAPHLFGRVPPLVFSKWWQPIRTGLYELDLETNEVIHLLDLPDSRGDTAFPSVLRIGPHTYLVANYTTRDPEARQWSWFKGEWNPTEIYFTVIHFDKVGEAGLRREIKLRRAVESVGRRAGVSPEAGNALVKYFLAVSKDPSQLSHRDEFIQSINYLVKKGEREQVAELVRQLHALAPEGKGRDTLAHYLNQLSGKTAARHE